MNTRKFKKGDKVWVDRYQYPYNSNFFGEWGVIVDYPSGENNLKNYTVKFKKRGGRFVVQEDHLHSEYDDTHGDKSEYDSKYYNDIHEDKSNYESTYPNTPEDKSDYESSSTQDVEEIPYNSRVEHEPVVDIPTVDDKVDYHDSHYKECVVEPILVMYKMFTKEEMIGFLKGNILKYRLRLGHKDDIQKEMDKIKRYEQWLNDIQSQRPLRLKR